MIRRTRANRPSIRTAIRSSGVDIVRILIRSHRHRRSRACVQSVFGCVPQHIGSRNASLPNCWSNGSVRPHSIYANYSFIYRTKLTHTHDTYIRLKARISAQQTAASRISLLPAAAAALSCLYSFRVLARSGVHTQACSLRVPRVCKHSTVWSLAVVSTRDGSVCVLCAPCTVSVFVCICECK